MLGKGSPFHFPDVIIATVAISSKLMLVTDNLKHYPMPEFNTKQIEAENRD